MIFMQLTLIGSTKLNENLNCPTKINLINNYNISNVLCAVYGSPSKLNWEYWEYLLFVLVSIGCYKTLNFVLPILLWVWIPNDNLALFLCIKPFLIKKVMIL